MMFNFWSVQFLGFLLAFDASLIVKASKVSEVQVASDLTLASNGSMAESRSAIPTHVPLNLHDTGSPIMHHSVKSDIAISSKVTPSTTLAPHSSSSLIVDKTHISITESSKAPTSHEVKHSTQITASSIKPSHVLLNKEENHASKLRDYLKPICDSVDRIQSKQLSKIQSQFKQFIHVSPKLSTCFLDHYKFDLTTSPISGHNLKSICSSHESTLGLPNSYESFLTCAKQHWSQFLDEEFDKTATGRANHIKEHQHLSNDNLELLEHDVEDVSLISGFIDKFFDNDKNVTNTSSDFSVLDIAITTPLPKLADSLPSIPAVLSTTTGAPNLMNDPNTFVVFMENSSTTALPTQTTTLSTSSKPITSIKDDTPIASNTSIASKDTKIEVKTVTAAASSATTTTAAPIKHLTTKSLVIDSSTAKPHLSSTLSPHIANTASVSVKVDMAANKSSPTSVKPLISILTTKKVDTIKKFAKGVTDKISGKPDSSSSTLKPVLKTMDSFEEILKKQEKVKQELELKLKLEREKFMKQLQKKQDEIDAQNAVRALQHQRDVSSSHSDAKLHQLEHDRQMTIDPVGHTLKHQQYELNKQQKMFAGK